MKPGGDAGGGGMVSEWRTAKLGEVVAFKTGKLDSNAAVPNGDYPFFTCSQETLRTNTFSFDTECVLLAGNNANGIYPLKYFHGKFDAYQRTYVVTPRDPNQLTTRFLYYTLRPKLSEFRSVSTGAATKFLTLTILNDTEIKVPPLPVQRRIAGILSAYDELIENNLRRIKILEEMARALYREWFVLFRFPDHEKIPLVDSPLGKIPKGWEVKQLNDVCHLTMGQSPKSEYYNKIGEGLPFHQGVTNFGDRFPTDRLYCSVEGRIAEPGDILFSVRAPVGRMNIAEKKMILGRGLSAIRHKDGHQTFLWEQLCDRFQEEDTIGNGAIFAAVTRDDMQNIQLICPTESVICSAESHLTPLHEEIAVLSTQTANLRSTRDLLLPRLLSGEVNIFNNLGGADI
ncbi:MAG: restriction endonuclease subunit S [Nitrospirae bacterium]|nr:restriction endonuclease subunit S [Nitrospirota bacterium]